MLYPSLANEKLADVLRLIRSPNVGPITFFQLMMRFGSAATALAELPGLSLRGGRKQAVKPYSATLVEEEIERALKLGARFIRYGEPDYPALLAHISDAPPVITVLGNSATWQEKTLIAMVGSRNASANGCQFAGKLARECGAAGLITVSGLARGIDGYVHQGSLNTGTVAVIAGGIDNIYPADNEKLYREIAASGAIISEQPFGQIPFAGAFPSRNRIIAGMSHGTAVIEASPKSGSLITARLALEYDRDLFAVPGSPLDPRAKGCNQLIKQGAHVVEDASDIIQLLKQSRLSQFSESTAPEFKPVSLGDNELAEARTKILDKLGYSAIGIDELVEQCGITAACAQAALLELELAGKVKRTSGNKVTLTYRDEQEVA